MKKLDFKKAGMHVISTGMGAVGAKILNKPLANMNPKLRAFLKIAGGVLLPTFAKNDFMQGIGSGLVAVGAAELVTEFMPGLAGIGDTDMSDVGFIEQSSTVSGPYDAEVYGTDDEMSGIGADENLTI